jgi:ABC-type antimicrobial peptide transport system permease subunit
MDQLLSRTLKGRGLSLFLLSSFALATRLLASARVYGVMSLSASERTREFGVRTALGAKRGDSVGLMLGERGLKLAVRGDRWYRYGDAPDAGAAVITLRR